MKPTVNLNGTSRESLIADRMAAMDAIYQAIEATRKLLPHGRDYPGNAEQYHADRDLHVQRIMAMSKIMEDIGQEALALSREGETA